MTNQTTTEPRRLVRRTDDKIVAGVASGLAAYLGVDPVLVRVGFVLAATAGGFGILAYIVLYVVTPEGETGHAPIENRRDAGFWVAIGLFVLAALAIADNVADRSFLWPVVLIAAGVALWRSSEKKTSTNASEPLMSTTPTTSTPTTPTRTSQDADLGATARMTSVSEPVAARPPVAPDWTPPPPPDRATLPKEPRGPKTPRPASRLGGVTVAIALLVTGIGLTLDQLGAISYPAGFAFTTALAILALGLIVGTWVGRARWLVFPALVLTPLVLVTGVSDNLNLQISAGIGERNFRPLTVEEVAAEYHLGLGQLTLDLSDLDLTSADTVTTTVSLGAGEILIYVPDGVQVTVDYAMGAGEVHLFSGEGDDHRSSGSGLDDVVVSDADEGAGRIVLDIDQTFGELNVERR